MYVRLIEPDRVTVTKSSEIVLRSIDQSHGKRHSCRLVRLAGPGIVRVK